jgi:hypothetical protein
MMGRRFLLVVAVLMGLTALAASVAPRDPAVRSGSERGAPAPAPAGGPSAGGTVVERISTAPPSERVVVTEGELLELEVAGSEIDTVVLLDEMEPVEPQSAARFNLLADEPGQYAIELLDAGRRVGTLVVREAG